MASIIISVPVRGSATSSRDLRSDVRILRNEIEVAPPNSESSKRSQVSRLSGWLPAATRASNRKGASAALAAIASRSPATGIPDWARALRIAVAVVLCARRMIAISE